MDSRQRVLLCLDRAPTDRLPFDFWASAGMRDRIERSEGISFARFLDREDVDLRYIEGPACTGPDLGPDMDIWGVRRARIAVAAGDGGESYSEVAESPLAAAETVAEVDDYARWPSPDWFDYSMIESQCDEILSQGRAVVFMGDRLNRVAQLKPAMYIRGMENILMDFALRPDLARAIFARIRAFYEAYLERILEAARGKIDIVLTGDDFGAQQGLMVSREVWRDFLEPGFRRYISLVHAGGARAMHHTCGAVRALLPDFIDAGLDVLQSLQPEAAGMDPRGLRDEFGDRICFHGGVSIQRTMPFGAPREIRDAVAGLAGLFREPGGFIFSTAHNIQADTPVENVLALLAAYRELGVRP